MRLGLEEGVWTVLPGCTHDFELLLWTDLPLLERKGGHGSSCFMISYNYTQACTHPHACTMAQIQCLSPSQ